MISLVDLRFDLKFLPTSVLGFSQFWQFEWCIGVVSVTFTHNV